MADRMRLDKFLVDSGHMSTRSEAQAAIDAGKVEVNGAIVTKASFKVAGDDLVRSEKAHPYVSRAALKLKGALDVFGIMPEGFVCLDIGCSTGGFTEVLIEAGAKHVFSVDVGTDQFHPSLRDQAHVSLFEQLDARKLTSEHIDSDVDLLVCDASFIGLEKVLYPAVRFVRSGGAALLLFKPQFQVGPKAVGKGGIVTDENAVDAAKGTFMTWLNENGFSLKGWTPSPITGSDGNQEWLVWAERR